MTDHIVDAITAAYAGSTRLPPELLAVDGMSSTRIRILLNELCRRDHCRYLEIGAFKGSTILAASYENRGRFSTIDNFSEFGGPKAELLANQKRFADCCTFDLIEADAWTVRWQNVAPRNVFFYDGRHHEIDQYRAFTHFDLAFDREFIALVDDWNVALVRDATRAAFNDLRYSVVDEWNLGSSQNGDRSTWWNGLYVALVQRF